MISLFQGEESSYTRTVRMHGKKQEDIGTISRKAEKVDTEDRPTVYEAARIIYCNAKRRQFKKPSNIF